MYEACSLTKVPEAVSFFNNTYFVVGGTDCNRGNMQQMVQHSVNHVIVLNTEILI
jgi:hypothetical protein